MEVPEQVTAVGPRGRGRGRGRGKAAPLGGEEGAADATPTKSAAGRGRRKVKTGRPTTYLSILWMTS